MTYEVVVIGGSYAGLAATLQIARARRSILVIDAGIRRNRFARTSHGFLGQDGRPPAAIVADARAQVLAYPNVRWVEATATAAAPFEGGFRVTADDTDYEGKRLLLALGVADELPAVPGLAERWGQSVFHCPYCHGYELNQGRIGVLATGPMSIHHAIMLPDWGPTTLFTNGMFEPDADQSAQLVARGVTIEREAVVAVTGAGADIVLRDGRTVPLDGLFTIPKTSVASPLAKQLGCAFEDGPAGAFIQTDGIKATTVPGVFACGDAARAFGSVSLAVGDGAMAGTAVHQSLITSPV
ncbi:MAG: NAD(P)/FAD-dependent oxidoreductase [Gemmatimonadales bacterium]